MAVLIASLPMVLAEEYSLLYDANGNLVYDQETDIYREYNELNQLIRTRINNASGTILQEYTWDPIEERIFIKDEFYNNGSLKLSTYYFGDDYIVIQNSSGTYNRTNIYQDGVLVGYEDFDSKKRYVLSDHKSSVHLVLNESGDVIEENLFSPFAEPLRGVKENKFSYEAKEYDSLTKDYDFHFRKLRTTGPPIFTQPDSLVQNVYDPQSLNRYSFEKNSPYKYIDEDGHLPFVLVAIAIVGYGIINAGVEAYIQSKYAGRIYSSERIVTSFAVGVVEAAAYATTRSLFVSTLSSIHTLYDIPNSIIEAKKHKLVEESKVKSEEDLKCKIINCDLKYEISENDEEKQSDSPSISNPSSQADSSKAISQGAQQASYQSGVGGGYIAGIGYVTVDGRTYPTNNPNFVPGTGNKPPSPGVEIPCNLNCGKILNPNPK